ncbi:cutinase family protein, partial [Paenarthrobacter nicotinovorans]|uniref:cutinase family protein n=1 Tax=Paenarthrobacter nicotinovorans TaxID=29320 RepID=UPI0038141F8C
ESWTMPTTGLPYLLSAWSYSPLLVTEGVTLTIQAGTVVKFLDRNSGLNIEGSLVVNGTTAAPVTFTSFQDDTAGGDTNGDAGATKPTSTDWSGLNVAGTLKAQHLVVRYASYPITGQPSYSDADRPSPLLELDNVRLQSALTCLTTGNDVRGHFHGAVANCATGVDSADPFDATNVEWGGGRGPGPDNGNPSIGGSAASVYPWVGVVLPPKPTTLPVVQAPNVCKPYLFIGVMGSGQRSEANNSDLLGTQVRAIRNQFAEEVGSDKIATLGLDYPAFPVPIVEEKSLQGIAQYVPGAWQGTLSLIWEIEKAAERCPDQKIVVAGYSQGAWVIHAALNYMAAAQSSKLQHVKGVSLLADPLRKPSDAMHHFGTATNDGTGIVNSKIGNVTVGMHDWMNGVVQKMYPQLSDLENVKMSLGGYPGSITGPTISICDLKDPVCAFTLVPPGIDVAVHTSYGPTDYLLLGRRLAQLMA